MCAAADPKKTFESGTGHGEGRSVPAIVEALILISSYNNIFAAPSFYCHFFSAIHYLITKTH
jgi:hypothetical protein